MKLSLKWSQLTDTQRKSIKGFYHEELQQKRLFEHDLNKRQYNINPTNGNVVFGKGF